MRYYIISDLHCDFYNDYRKEKAYLCGLERIKKEYKIDGLLIAGDVANNYVHIADFFSQAIDIFQAIYWCPGNHDLMWDDRTQGGPKKSKQSLEENWDGLFGEVGYLEKVALGKGKIFEILDGNVVKLHGTDLTIGGCHGIYDFSFGSSRKVSQEARLRWENWFDCFAWVLSPRKFIEGFLNPELQKLNAVLSKKPDIIMTHTIPSKEFCHPDYKTGSKQYASNYFFMDEKYIKRAANENTVLWICGHTHKRIKGQKTFRKECKVLCNPYGYPGEVPAFENDRNFRIEDFILEY